MPSKSKKNEVQAVPWQSKIVGHGRIRVDQVLFHPDNWRKHPMSQRQAFRGLVKEIGFLRSITINKRTSDKWPVGEREIETLIDGHMRVLEAAEAGQDEIDVEYVDLDPDQERMALASIDPLATAAFGDKETLDRLMQDVRSTQPPVQQFFADLWEDVVGGNVLPTQPTEAKYRENPYAQEYAQAQRSGTEDDAENGSYSEGNQPPRSGAYGAGEATSVAESANEGATGQPSSNEPMRVIQMYMPLSQYERVLAQLKIVAQALGTPTVTDTVLKLIEEGAQRYAK